VGGDVARGSLLEAGQVRVKEARPDLFLPEAVEGFDGVLEPPFPDRGKDWDDAAGQAEKRERTERTGMDMRAVETRVVVEADEIRTAESLPVRLECFAGSRRSDGGHRPRFCQAAVNGCESEDLDIRASFDDEPLDHIATVELALAHAHRGQMPAWRRRGTADSGRFDAAVPGENSGDGSGGWARPAAGEHMPADRLGPALAQSAFFRQANPEGEDGFYRGCRRGVFGRFGTSRQVGDIDVFVRLSAGSVSPILDLGEADAELSGDGSERLPGADGCDDQESFLVSFLCMLGTIPRCPSPPPARFFSTPLRLAPLACAPLRKTAQNQPPFFKDWVT